jgi:O-antigen ligase
MIFYLWLIWVLPLTQHPIWGARIGPLTGFEYLGLAAFSYAVVHVRRNRQSPAFLKMPQTCALLLFSFLTSLSVLGSGGSMSLKDNSFIAYCSSMLLFLITLAVVDSLQRFRRVVLITIGSYAFASLYLLREWQSEHTQWSSFRPGWIAGDANYFSCAALSALLPAIYLAASNRRLGERLFCAGCLLLICLAFSLCASRGAFVGLAAAAVYSIWHSRHRIRNLAVLVVLVVPISFLLPNSPLRRFTHPEAAEQVSEDAHWEAWRAGFKMIDAHPLTGVGVGRFKQEMPGYAAPGLDVDSIGHNMFIEIAAEMGIPAALLFLSIFVFNFRGLANLRKELRKQPSAPQFVKQMAMALSASLVALFVSGMFISAEYQKTTWFAMALAASLSSPAFLRAIKPEPVRPGAKLSPGIGLAVVPRLPSNL